MTNRKNASNAGSSPKKEKKSETFAALKSVKAEKRPAADSSDSEPEDFEEEQITHTEAEETRNEDNGQAIYEPDVMRPLIESFLEFLVQRQSETSTVHNMENKVAEWAETRRDDNIDAGLFVLDFRKYLKSAVKFKNLQMNDSCAAISTYLNSEKSLVEYKSMPDRPPTKIQLYIKKHQIMLKGIGGEPMKNAYKAMNADTEGAKELDELLREASLQYIPQLQEFLDTHPNLTEEQKRSIVNKMKMLNKKYNSKEISSTPKKRSSKKDPETAFSLFCRTKNDKYRDLSDEEREIKLQKKFEKLPAAQKDIYESLAISM